MQRMVYARYVREQAVIKYLLYGGGRYLDGP